LDGQHIAVFAARIIGGRAAYGDHRVVGKRSRLKLRDIERVLCRTRGDRIVGVILWRVFLHATTNVTSQQSRYATGLFARSSTCSSILRVAAW
jgi:hypothetical protein